MDYYTVSEAAAKIGVSVSTLKRWERAGEIPAAKREQQGNHDRVYSNQDLLKIIEIKKIGKINGSEKSYADAGVDTFQQDIGLKRIIKKVHQTWKNKNGIGAVELDIGPFANVINIGNGQGICVATDGVGTKALIALRMNKYDTIGIDCIAMNVNDVICVGAKPLTLVDYIAVRKPAPDLLEKIMEGLCAGANLADISISGGETAILPDLLAEHQGENSFDLVGTAVGMVSLDKIIVGRQLKEGDILVGIESNGIHSNGLTLARHAFFEWNGHTLDSEFPELDHSLGEELLRPTHIYVREVQELLEQGVPVKALVHITSDGLLNLNRVAAPVGYIIDDLPEPPPIFSLIQQHGNVSDEEMYRVYNMGIGFCIAVNEKYVDQVISIVRSHKKKAYPIGRVFDDREKRVYLPAKKLVGKGKQFTKTERLPVKIRKLAA